MHRFSKKVSMTVVKRLPKYYQYLTDLQLNDIEKISSRELASLMGLTASQIRQDLNSFGGYGQQGYGYNVSELRNAIKDILGLDYEYSCIIIGAGNMGHAIANYERFRREGIILKGVFDVDPLRIGTVVGSVVVKHMDELEEFVSQNEIDVCILCVPREVGQQIANQVTSFGIQGILNFSPMDLEVPKGVEVENVNITDSLFTLTYRLKDYKISTEDNPETSDD
ncbi:MAG: redox-sensing transcriptional repressor [Eubacteriaceae bacterium]|jgi:redox-sensing transcriptional repressor|nr:redox-sensing transcriptional repressor [Eubacteriaceae bacterium]MDK2905751.1 redox-sensing transcriptional repressor [Eubacteriaceae bacterium]MDK2936069.1 redox-sensing transcriptional repressor [Eubacteriaceae bacterium]MDK2960885.1 redox-sensing transcriptional repressor [Eubacteriaceae bacterium]MDN5307028.1 redox-sensing transcriptional repressor [Eubacteriaceae bacterium]